GPPGEQPLSWLAALRARLGLPGAPTLRATLEEALKGEGQGFSLCAFAGLLRTSDAAGVSRMPLFRETLDDPRGMVHIKDLMRWLMGDALGRPASEGHAPISMRPAPLDAAVAVPDLSRVDLSKPIVAAKLRRPMIFVPPS